jgi:hypothetical protein
LKSSLIIEEVMKMKRMLLIGSAGVFALAATLNFGTDVYAQSATKKTDHSGIIPIVQKAADVKETPTTPALSDDLILSPGSSTDIAIAPETTSEVVRSPTEDIILAPSRESESATSGGSAIVVDVSLAPSGQ